jgi:hypothetical protein
MRSRGDRRIGELTAKLEAAALAALAREFDHWNAVLFGRALRRPVFELGDGETQLGSWTPERRRLRLARGLLAEHGWGAVVEVLKHEMAHQYVDEVLGRADEPPHGPSFERVCRERAIDARRCGEPAPAQAASHPVLDRIAKLLALAESPNEHEAQAAMNAAQRIMLRHNIDVLAAKQPHGYGFRHLGRPTGRISEAERTVAQILSDHFFVDVLWVPVWRALEGRRGSVLEVCGRLENLDLAEYVHGFLGAVADALWREHKRRGGIRRDRDRQAYLAGVMSGFAQRLAEERERSAESGLVWIGDSELAAYLKQRHPHTRTVWRRSTERSAAHGAGRRAGRDIVLRRGVGSSSAGGVRALLPPKI